MFNHSGSCPRSFHDPGGSCSCFLVMVVHVHVCSWPWWFVRILFNVHAGLCPCYVKSIVVPSHGLCTYTHVFMMLLSMLLLIKAAHVHSLLSFPARLAAQRARVL